MFEVEQFVADCRAAQAADPSHKGVREVVARAVADPAAVIRAFGEPKRGEAQLLYHAADLTIINLIWAPRMCVMPHNHNMWAVIGIYAGREDNLFWRRCAEAPGKVTAAGAQSLCVGDVAPLGKDIIHSVLNPITKLSCALHVYGGDFFNAPRSEWDSETLDEHAFDARKVKRLFDEANAAFPLG
jgi:predicted metal-dependent enzyme (double-stranded beta helix superfamily)